MKREKAIEIPFGAKDSELIKWEYTIPEGMEAEIKGDDGSFGVTPLFVMSNIRSAFKAGAKWMAEQGYTTETRVDRTPMNGPIGICLHLHDSTGFKIDDKVIVQIRKKQ